jgi:hypothetical protein
MLSNSVKSLSRSVARAFALGITLICCDATLIQVIGNVIGSQCEFCESLSEPVFLAGGLWLPCDDLSGLCKVRLFASTMRLVL